jgi:hypothetical protein
MYYLRIYLSRRPLESFQLHTHAPSSRKTPWKEVGRRNWVPGGIGGGPRRNPAAPMGFLAGGDVEEV